MLRYSKSAIVLASLAAVLWAGSITLLIAQLDGVTPSPLASYTALIALGLTVWWAIDRVAARLMSRDTRPPIVVHADWSMDLASRTTIANQPRSFKVSSVPVPVPSCAGSGETTLTMRVGRQPAREAVPEDVYFAAFDAVAEEVLADFDRRDGGADSVQ